MKSWKARSSANTATIGTRSRMESRICCLRISNDTRVADSHPDTHTNQGLCNKVSSRPSSNCRHLIVILSAIYPRQPCERRSLRDRTEAAEIQRMPRREDGGADRPLV